MSILRSAKQVQVFLQGEVKMNTIEQAREISYTLRTEGHVGSYSRNIANTIDVLITKLKVESEDNETHQARAYKAEAELAKLKTLTSIQRGQLEADDLLLKERDAELAEQCRLNGMGSEREASLLGKVERQRRVLAQALEALQYLTVKIADGWDLGTQQRLEDEAITAIQEVLK